MVRKISEEIKTDPSDVHQNFKELSVKLLCCRYWILEEWECDDFKAPFWRIYYNSLGGSTIKFKDRTIPLNNENIIIIPPNTSFSSQLRRNFNHEDESILGRKFIKTDDLDTLKSKGKVDHFFIHFSLGYPLDFSSNRIHEIKLNEVMNLLVKEIKNACITDSITSMKECLRVKHLIAVCLLNLPDDIWESGNIDQRILKSIKFIEGNFRRKITNEQLADSANMAINSFARLFKMSTKITTQQYILKLRVEAACHLMHHSNKSLDEVSYECGFSDRHHFSKIFKKIMKVNPSDYKRQLKIV
ncbi:AraC family transcriptional regulator [Pedobacter lusitanus]|uniref:AraC family transcriptional regulator n=1 Tax=Pedobacter lusitanus TaxID=1503925 RepID=A0A0D0GSV0_9SPHI|nr:AraC family transcriptional regulator [Pedobacter lusitanus]KIO77556.1 AraC family transcriptional regulator [Pedobacter lusitanus]